MTNDKNITEPESTEGTRFPGSDAELGTRIGTAISRVGGLRAAAKIAGISDDSLANWRDLKTKPAFQGMALLAQAAGIRLDWLATGQGPMEIGTTMTSAGLGGQLDEELIASVMDGIAKVYKEEGARIGPADLGRLGGRLVNELASAYEDPNDRPVGLKALLGRLRVELRTPPTQDTQSKRSA